ncbi:MAG: enolase C-terminal domain-like protein, partial [Vicinamibacterales bacterium]
MFRITSLRLRLLRLPLVAFFETSFARVYDKTFILVTIDGEGTQGLGECVADVDPYYSSETNVSAWHVIKEFIAPLVLGRSFTHPREIFPSLARVRGHHMAKASIEMAAWDLAARVQGVPLSRLLGGTQPRIASGVSIGIQDTLDDLIAKVGKELDAGYRRIKIKIKPGWDENAVAALRARFGPIPLMVDANAAYTLADAPRLAR